MKIPNKIKVFTWRACKEGLPTLEILKIQKVIMEASCQWCNKNEGDVSHALLSYPLIRECWCKQFPNLLAAEEQIHFLHTTRKLEHKGIKGELENFFLMV